MRPKQQAVYNREKYLILIEKEELNCIPLDVFYQSDKNFLISENDDFSVNKLLTSKSVGVIYFYTRNYLFYETYKIVQRSP